MKQTVLILDDEIVLLKAVQERLEMEQYTVVTCTTAEQALSTLGKTIPDIMIVDVRLPGMNGFDFCKKLRQSEGAAAKIPLIFLTTASDETSKVLGLELGGDDYITKPYNPGELLARIRAILRRSQRAQEEVETLVSGQLRLDIAAHTVVLNDKPIDLSPKEFELLHTFLLKKGRVLTRHFLMERIWGQTYEATTRTIDTHVKQLRQALDKYGKCIKTVEGLGYKWEDK